MGRHGMGRPRDTRGKREKGKPKKRGGDVEVDWEERIKDSDEGKDRERGKRG